MFWCSTKSDNPTIDLSSYIFTSVEEIKTEIPYNFPYDWILNYQIKVQNQGDNERTHYDRLNK